MDISIIKVFESLSNEDQLTDQETSDELLSNLITDNNEEQDNISSLDIDLDDHVLHILEGNETNSEESTVVDSNQCTPGAFLPNPLNCSAFFHCDHGRLTAANCPPHMWFDPNFQNVTICNHPEVVCAADNSVCNCATEYPPLAPDPLIESSVQCLKDNRFHLSASNVDCGRYFICYNEHVFRMECRAGFHYNHQTEMCDYPELVNCKVNFINWHRYFLIIPELIKKNNYVVDN